MSTFFSQKECSKNKVGTETAKGREGKAMTQTWRFCSKPDTCVPDQLPG